MGHGGWSLFFEPEAVQGVLELASQWADDADPYEAYNKIIKLLYADPAWRHLPAQPIQPVFPESDLRKQILHGKSSPPN